MRIADKETIKEYALLVKAVKAGDRKATERLYYIFIAIARIAIQKHAYNSDAKEQKNMAHDIASTVFEKLHKYQSNRKLFSWVFKLSINFLIDAHRRRIAKPAISLVFVDERVDGFYLKDNVPTPEDILIQKENSKEIQRVLEALPPDKLILILEYAEERKTMKMLGLVD